MAELLDLCAKVAGWAAPGEQVEAFAVRVKSTTVRVYEGEVESFTSSAPYGAGIRVVVDGRQGFASAGTLDEAVLKETLDEARDNARFAQPDEHAGLAKPDDLPKPSLPGLYRPDVDELTAERKIETALELERMTLARDARLRVNNAIWNDSTGEQALATSTGISSWGRSSICSASVGAMADDGTQTQTGGGRTLGRAPSELLLEEASEEAAIESLRMLGATKPRSAKVTAVLMPDVTLQFLMIITRMLNGEAVLKGRTPFADRLGQDIGAPSITLVDDATDIASGAAWPDDDEGITSRRNVLIENGALKAFLYDTYTGRRAGTGSTGSAARGITTTPHPAARAISLIPGTLTQDELIAQVGEGVLVQSVTGLHSGVSPVSGDFSVGASGLMIRGGALAEPVQEMTIASTLQRMLLDVDAVGGDLRWLGGSAGLTLAIRDVSLGGL